VQSSITAGALFGLGAKLEPLTEEKKNKSLNDTVPYYFLAHPDELLAKQVTSASRPPKVGVSFWTLSWEEYVEIGTNLFLGFFEKTLEIESTTVGNCTQYTVTTITVFQQIQLHYEAERWEQMVEESGEVFYQIDPFAKACVPALYDVYVNSDEYGPSFTDSLSRLHYNTMYRLGDVFVNLYRIDASVKAFVERTYDFEEKTAAIFAT